MKVKYAIYAYKNWKNSSSVTHTIKNVKESPSGRRKIISESNPDLYKRMYSMEMVKTWVNIWYCYFHLKLVRK